MYWFAALQAALASVTQTDYTLLDCAEDRDGLLSTGRPVTDPVVDAAETDADKALREKHRVRNQRLGAAILRYINVKSQLYRYLRTADFGFGANGRLIFRFVKTHGILQRTQEQILELKHRWREASMHSVGIRIHDRSLFEWRDWILNNAELCNERDPAHWRVKFFGGLPTAFNDAVMHDKLSSDTHGVCIRDY